MRSCKNPPYSWFSNSAEFGPTKLTLDRKTPAETAKLILERLKANGIDTRKRKDTSKSIAASTDITSIPNNLPGLQFFFGRNEELKKIADALAPKTRTWGVLIDGPGGMGKTSLAIRAAELAPTEQFQHASVRDTISQTVEESLFDQVGSGTNCKPFRNLQEPPRFSAAGNAHGCKLA